jgi:hypothetical protein
VNYFSSLVLKSKELESLKAKYQILTSRSINRSVSHDIIIQSPELKNLEAQVSRYKKEHDALSKKLLQPASEINLERSVKTLEQKILTLRKENHRLASSSCVLPKIVNPNTFKAEFEEGLRQVKALKKAINEIEDQLEQDSEICRQKQEKYARLFVKYEKLREEAGNYIVINNNKGYFKRKKYLETLETSWKSNITKFEQMILELEEEQANLKEELMHLTAKTFKKTQQQRLLKMSYDEMILKQEEGHLSAKPDINHPSESFMYKPSVKSLYNI